MVLELQSVFLCSFEGWHGKKAEFEFDLTLLLQLNGAVPHDNLVLIKMRPDEHGRFGFNVKVRVDNKWGTKGKSVFSFFSSSHDVASFFVPTF